MRKDSGDTKVSTRTMKIKSADFLQTSFSGNHLTASAPERTPTKNHEVHNKCIY